MSELRERLQADLAVNLKARNELPTTVIRSVLGAIQTQEKAGKTAVTFNDADVQAAVTRAVKTRRESAGIYKDAGQVERAERETAEADFLAAYLPAQLTEAEVAVLVENAVTETGAESGKDFGKVMKAVVAAASGAADGKTISRLVKARLG